MMWAESFLVVATVMVVLPAIMADAFLGGPSATFVVPQKSPVHAEWVVLRGGATAVGDKEEIEFESSDEELEEESDEEEEEEEEEELDPKLAKSAQAKAASVKTKMAKAAVKAAVSASVMPQKKKKNSSSRLSFFHIPYIIKACMNPFTLMKMTRAYFASLIQLDYLKETEDSSQNLRSALEEKAKKGGGNTRGKRKFKPGQAKVSTQLANTVAIKSSTGKHARFNLLTPYFHSRLCRTCLSSTPEVKKGMPAARE
jgi:hypothetical protein